MNLLILARDDPWSAMLEAAIRERWPESRVILEYSGDLVLKHSHRYPPDLVIIDADLASLDWRTVVQKLREGPEVSIILLSSGGEEKIDQVEALNLGADFCMTGSFIQAEVLARAQALLRRKGWRRDSASA